MIRQNRSIAMSLLITFVPTSVFAQTPVTEFGRAVANWRPPVGLVLQQVTPVAACDASTAKGRVDATARHGSAAWFLGGVGAGVGLGFIGTGVITGASAIANPQPKIVPSGSEENCYRDGYSGKAKKKNVMSALLGGLVGTGAWLAIYLARNSD